MRWAPLALEGARLTMEVAWITIAGALALLMIGAGESLVPVWLALIVTVSGYILTRWVVPADAPMAAARGIVAGGGAIVIYLGVVMLPQVGWDFSWPLWFWQDWQEGRHPIVGGIMLGVFWWRGTHLGQEFVWVNTLAQSFRIGVAVVVVGVVVDVLIDGYSGAPIPTFLFFGMGIASFALIHITSMDPEQSAGLKDWPRMMALTVGGILIGSLLLAVLAEGELGRVAATVFGLAGRLFLPVLAVVGWVFEIIIQAFVWAFFAVINIFSTEGESVEFNLPSAPDYERIFTRDEGENRLLYWLSRILGWAAVTAAVLGVGWILWRLFSGVRGRRSQGEMDEERERLQGETTIVEDLSSALSALAARFRRPPKHDEITANLDPNNPVSVALGAYRGLVALADDHGVAREGWETPQEFQPELSRLFVGQDIGIFTDSFVRARYGGIPPSREDVGQIRTIWANIRELYPPPRHRPETKAATAATEEERPVRAPLPRWLRVRSDLRPHEESPPPGMGPDDARMM
ncbi:MAG: DUF4129 domain-containing protein [Chloroflexi bacterium]|nr:DUF4129 domain-containing protein [Chloroflexota bacterium]